MIGHRQKRPSAVQLDRCLRAQISPGYARHMHAAVHMHHKDSIMSVSSDPRPGITATEFSETAPRRRDVSSRESPESPSPWDQ